MYSNTYNSPEDYERAHAQMRFRANGHDITDRVRAVDGSDVIARAVESGEGTRPLQDEIRQALTEFRDRYASEYGEAPRAVEAFLYKPRPFDWQAGRFNSEVLEPLGTVELTE
jgi:hypothetical protein